MTTLTVFGASGQIDSAFKGSTEFMNAELVIHTKNQSSVPEEESQQPPNTKTAAKGTKVLFCLQPARSQHPFVFNQAALRIALEDGAHDLAVILESITFGQNKSYDVNKTYDESKAYPQADGSDYIFHFNPPLGWTTPNTPLAFTFSIKCSNKVRIRWLELDMKQ